MRARWCGPATCNRRRGTSPPLPALPCYPHQDGSPQSRAAPTAQRASDSPRSRSPPAHCPARTARRSAPPWSDSRRWRSGSLLASSLLRGARGLPRLAPPDRPTPPASETTPPAAAQQQSTIAWPIRGTPRLSVALVQEPERTGAASDQDFRRFAKRCRQANRCADTPRTAWRRGTARSTRRRRSLQQPTAECRRSRY